MCQGNGSGGGDDNGYIYMCVCVDGCRKNKPGLRDITKVRRLRKAAFANLPVVNCMLRQVADDKRERMVSYPFAGREGG